MRRLVIRKEARADILEARSWYDRASETVGDRFLHTLNAVLATLSASPGLWPDLAQGVRRAPVKGFPYPVYYIADERKLTVVAVVHHRRDPKTWRRRVGLNEGATTYATTGIG